jgi:glycine/D-amino acid oxidase-like deaminating enzyme
MAPERFDLIIVGGGAVGLAAAYHAEKRGKKTLVLEQHDLFHDHTASSGATRQFRIQYNDPTVSRLVLDSIPLWEELERRSRDELQKKVGCLWFGDPLTTGAEGQIKTVLGVMKDLGVPYEEISSGDLMRRFDFTDIPAGWSGFFQPDGASTNVKATLRALAQAASASPQVVLKPRHRVVGLDSGPDGVRVETEGGGAFSGDKLILTPGPGVNDVLRLLGAELVVAVWEMISAYFPVRSGPVRYPTWINFQDQSGEDPGLYYGFPETEWERPGFVRVAANYPSRILPDLSGYTGAADARVVQQIAGWVRDHMKGLAPVPDAPSACVCALFTDPASPSTLRHEMLLDFAPPIVPSHRNVVLCATGWVFKLVPLLGKICVDLAVDGGTRYDISSAALSPDMWRRSVRAP